MSKRLTIKMVALLLIAFVASCQKESKNPNVGTYAEPGSAIVINEGAWGSNNGSISFIDRNGQVTNNIFELANAGAALGDVVQSYSKVGNKGLICVNNSQKIEIVDNRTFQRLATITAGDTTSYPRYSIGVSSNKAYISNGSGAGIIAVLNLDNYTITKTIPVGKGPNQMEMVDEYVYVCNSGGWGVDSTISIINANTETVEKTLVVGDIPSEFEIDIQGNLWVLCNGQTDYSAWPNMTNLSPTKIVKINTTTNMVEKTFTIANTGDLTVKLNMTIGNNGRTIYYAKDNDIYALNINDNAVPSTKSFTTNNIYGLAASLYNNQIWVTQAPSFSSGGYVFRYTESGNIIDSIQVGIGPNGVVFNP